MGKGYTIQWRGDEAGEKARQVARLAVTRGGIAVVSTALPNTPVKTGTLRRSLHVAPPGADHGSDQARAQRGDTLRDGVDAKEIASKAKGQVVAQVGSWLNYALIQELRRGYLMGALDGVRGLMPRLVEQARREIMGR